MNGDNVTYLDSFEAEHVPKEITKKNRTKIQQQIFIEFKQMIQLFVDIFVLDLKSKSLLDHTNLFSPNEDEKNHKMILKYFQ